MPGPAPGARCGWPRPGRPRSLGLGQTQEAVGQPRLTEASRADSSIAASWPGTARRACARLSRAAGQSPSVAWAWATAVRRAAVGCASASARLPNCAITACGLPAANKARACSGTRSGKGWPSDKARSSSIWAAATSPLSRSLSDLGRR